MWEKLVHGSWRIPGTGEPGGMPSLGWHRVGHDWSDLAAIDSNAGRDWGQEQKGTTEDKMAGWHHWLDGRESEWTLGVGDGQGGLVCCNSWGRKESNTTERLNWTELNWTELTLSNYTLVLICFIYENKDFRDPKAWWGNILLIFLWMIKEHQRAILLLK